MESREEREKRAEIMRHLIYTPYSSLKSEIQDLTPEKAHQLWERIKDRFPGVCFKAGMGNITVRMEWTSLMRKMVLIREKAKEYGPGLV